MRALRRYPTFPRRLAFSAAFAVALAVAAGCGGGKTKSSDPLAEALAFFPPNAAILIVGDTDTSSPQFKNLNTLGSKFPGWGALKKQILDELGKESVNFDADIKPWLGNAAVIGARTMQEADDEKFIGAMVVRDEGALQRFLDKQVSGKNLQKAGGYQDARLYTSPPDTALAVRGADLVLADTVDQLKQAIDLHDSDKVMTADAFKAATEGLPGDAILKLYMDMNALLADTSTPAGLAQARKVPWVAALSTLGMTARANPSDVELKARVGTDRKPLKPEQLPLAPDAPTPALPGGDTLGAVGLSDLAHVVHFSELAAQAANPTSYASYQQGIILINKQLGLDLRRDLVDQLQDDAVLSFNRHGYGFRAKLADPRKASDVLAKLKPVAPAFLSGAGARGVKISQHRNGAATLYTVGRGGRTLARYGVIDNALVVAGPGRDPVDVAASGGAKSAPAEPGALTLMLDTPAIIDQLVGGLSRLGVDAAPFVKPIGRLSGSVANTPKALTATARVELK